MAQRTAVRGVLRVDMITKSKVHSHHPALELPP